MSAPTIEAPPAVTAGAAQHTGAMIALVPTDEDCARLAIDGYEPAAVLHTTLVFLGDAADWDNQSRDILEGAIRELEAAKALRGDVWAHAQFNPASDEPCAVYLVGAPGIEDVHSAVQGAVEESADWFPQIPDQHTPWIPHITAGYGLPATELTDVGPVTFDRIRLSFADEDIRDIALTNTSERLVAAAESGHLDDPAALTASVAAGIPVTPPAEWFEDPHLDAPTPITVTPEGRIYGTLGSWKSCHIGYGDECVPPPKSKTDYAYFCNGLVLTADGTDIHTGRITMGTGHAGLRMKPRHAAAHYDDTGTCVADVTAGEDPHGIWVAGAIRPGTTDEQLRALRASPLSGDWREINGNLELVAALAVNVPGFNIPRPKSLAASGHRALTAAGVVPLTNERKTHAPAPVTAEDRAQAQFFSAPELTVSIAREVRASRIRETNSEKLAARIRSARMDAATRRVALVAAGRTVRTPAGADHYGQPVGSRILVDGPDIPDTSSGGDSRASSDNPDAPIEYGPDYVARGLKLYMEPTTPEFRQRAAAGELEYDELLDQLNRGGNVGQWWGIMDSEEDPNYFGSIEDFEGYGHVEPSESVARELRDYQESLDDGETDPRDYSDSVNMGIVMVADRPEINGQPFDPDNNAQVDGGLMGNSYLPDGTLVTVREIRYDAGNGWVSVRGNRAVRTNPDTEELTASAGQPIAARLRLLVRRMSLVAAAPKTDGQKAKPPERYWTKGPGLARWAESSTPFRTLVAQLREEIPATEMTDDQLHGLAATYYKKVMGKWPGKKREDKGSRVASLVDRMSAITAAGKHRRVETPEGAEHYGQPVGSIIVTDVPKKTAPKEHRSGTAKKPDETGNDEPLPQGFEKKYRGTDIDSVPTKDVYGITEALLQWESSSKSEYSNSGTMEGDLSDYDIPATATDLIRSGINASFLHTGVGPGGEHEIEDDDSGNAEWDRLGGIINDALLANRREEPRPTNPEVFGPPSTISEMSNSEIANLYADVSVLLGGDSDAETTRRFISTIARRGLNVRAGMDDSAAPPDVREAVRRNLWSIWTGEGVE